MKNEKRVFSRIKLISKTSLYFKKKRYPVKLHNISLQGATVLVDDQIMLNKGNNCLLKINPEGSDITMDLEALTMYHKQNRIGFQFCENSQKTVKELCKLISSNFDKTE